LGHVAAWKVLEEMIGDFRKKGATVPAEVMGDLKNAKTMIKILKADPSRGEILQKIDEYMGNVESYLVSEGAKRFGPEYIEEWLKRVEGAGRKIADEEEEERFIPGLPRQQTWIRVLPSVELSLEKLKALAQESSLLYNVQPDGYLLVYGEDKTVKAFVKKIATKCGLKAGK
jgi:hypothetical protein